MYLRLVRRKAKSGRDAAYLQLAHNYRDPITRLPRAKILYSLGRLNEQNRVGLQRLAGNLQRVLCREYGGAVDAADDCFDQEALDDPLRLSALIKRLAPPRSRGQILKGLTILTHASPFASPNDRQCCDVDLAMSARAAMLFLHRNQAAVFRRLTELTAKPRRASAKSVFVQWRACPMPAALTYMDRAELAQAWGGKTPTQEGASTLAVAFRESGVPFRCWITLGPPTDEDLCGMIDDLNKLGVMDPCFLSPPEAGLGDGHISGRFPVRRARLAPIRPKALPQGRWASVDTGLQVKRMVPLNEQDASFAVKYAPLAMAETRRLEARLALLEEELAQLNRTRLPERGHTEATGRLATHPEYGPLLRIDAKGHAVLNRRAVREAQRRAGIMALHCGQDDWSPKEAAQTCTAYFKLDRYWGALSRPAPFAPATLPLQDRLQAQALLNLLRIALDTPAYAESP